MSNTVIIDLGSQTIRFGLSGNQLPSIYYIHFDDIEIVEKLNQNKTVQRRSNPMSRGKVIDWEELQDIFEEVFESFKNSYYDDILKDASVFVTHPLNTQTNFPFQMEQILFEYFGVSNVCLKPQPLMALIQSNKTSGYVVQSGSEITQIACYNQMRLEPGSCQNVNIGGIDITKDFNQRFHQNLYDIDTDKKKELFFIPKELQNEGVDITSLPYQHVCYSSNKDQVIDIGNERFYSTEILFKGKTSITSALTKSICTVSMKNKILRDICVCGGNSFIHGFIERIQHNADSIQNNFFRTYSINTLHESFSGANIYSGFPSFKYQLFSISKYEEEGTYVFY
ncbi:actin, putative [Entamoeba histolytica HM-1:IMSS-B]|uniref:Actin, putative n=6 Tax=Entamoeba histolytica TaxID=5759 RepID=C4M3P3_ENTH1|nr:actin, putative [Entamoeba histolytica HM-1:IMSS]EMD42955.1 actin, putative [Entamoeba histolytica KU27]EMH76891.1 actin, putative [Entamoeba histolytica HM-1:IMSS-B]EMS17502.1 actin, putative [Entamoeba histolytica HM-3:IMSS]ENY61237.1 actin, putative [Entamoeba histolytica HM-1:IMSS-A]GAT95945.1 actin putative [Entamoeba histolytica]|eukprot:XP_654203.1 actin, putative [Entamoeba histolytica HM-1:IMSS]